MSAPSLSLKSIILAGVLLGATAFKADSVSTTKIKHERFQLVNVPEPSDVARDPETGHLFIVSDNGLLFETDAAGKVLRKAVETGWDFEGVEVHGGYVYAADESSRRVHRYNKETLVRDHIYTVPYSGARNSGFESIAWNDTKKCWVLVTEKSPITIFELNEDFQVTNQQDFTAARDIASARWYGGSMYLLSDEDETIIKCDPTTYAVQAKYKTAVLNPEGLCFDAEGRVIIAADDLQRLYFFKALPAL